MFSFSIIAIPTNFFSKFPSLSFKSLEDNKKGPFRKKLPREYKIYSRNRECYSETNNTKLNSCKTF